ncbi:MAG: hypothetical protein RI953_1330 [Pseudomonadota bacterium]|jgi:hypothetical protein
MTKVISYTLALFFAAMGLGMLSSPAAIERFFVLQTPVFDAAHYLKIATQGYIEAPLAAFYPLWPQLLKIFILPFSSPENVVLAGSLFAFVLFALSLFPFAKVALRDLSASAGFCLLIMYALNPNSLFHVLLYTESLTALSGSLFLLSLSRLLSNDSTVPAAPLQKKWKWYLLAAGSLIALSLGRPVGLPLIASFFASTVCVFFFRAGSFSQLMNQGWSQRVKDPLVIFAVLCSLAVVIGYIPYGLHAAKVYGDFLAPFDAQKYWDRSFGLHWDIIFRPKSVSKSDNVLFWDIQAFYLPFVLLALPFLAQFKVLPSAFISLGHDWLYWLCAFFAAAHSAIAFLTFPIFMSLARHVFALPFIFYCVGRILAIVWHQRAAKRLAWGYACISAVFLVYWWSRYAREGWLG